MGLILFLALLQTPPQTAPAVDPVDHALEMMRQQKSEAAYTELRDIVKADPANIRAEAFLAAAELQTGRLDDCQRHVTELVEKDPKNPDMRELKGQLLMAKRDWKNAETEWRWIIGERPNSEQAHMQLAAVLLQEDRFAEGLAEVTHSLEINPKRGDARSLRGNIEATLGRMDDAALDWNIALVSDPNDTVALSGLAVYLRLSDPKRALSLAQQALDLTQGKSLGPVRVLSLVYRAQGQNDKAREVIEHAMLTFPNNEALVAELNNIKNPPPASTPPVTTAKNTPAPKKPEPKPVVKTPPPVIVKAEPPAPEPTPTAGVSAPPASAPLTTGKSAPPTATTSTPPTTGKPAPTMAAVTPTPTPPPTPPAYAPPPLALGGLTLGATMSDLMWLKRSPLPPAPEKEQIVVALAPRAPVNPKAPKVTPKESVDIPPPELFWGRLPLSTITPAFVYANVPPPAGEAPTSLGEAARRIRDQKKKP